MFVQKDSNNDLRQDSMEEKQTFWNCLEKHCDSTDQFFTPQKNTPAEMWCSFEANPIVMCSFFDFFLLYRRVQQSRYSLITSWHWSGHIIYVASQELKASARIFYTIIFKKQHLMYRSNTTSCCRIFLFPSSSASLRKYFCVSQSCWQLSEFWQGALQLWKPGLCFWVSSFATSAVISIFLFQHSLVFQLVYDERLLILSVVWWDFELFDKMIRQLFSRTKSICSCFRKLLLLGTPNKPTKNKNVYKITQW